MADHRFSGYPGGWCLSCGQDDLYELCLARHPEHWREPSTPDNHYGAGDVCQNGPCPEPGSNRWNPYVRVALTRTEGES